MREKARMANEVSANLSLTVAKNGASIIAAPSGLGTMSGDQMLANIQIVTTTAEALVLGDVSTIGGVFIRNLDPTNFCYISLNSNPDASNSFAKLTANTAATGSVSPGSWCYVPTGQTTIYAESDTANVNLQILAWEL